MQETTNELKIDLAEFEEIMNLLPDGKDHHEQRKNSLTREDALVIAKIVQALSHSTCAMGFTRDEISKIKTVISIANKGILGIGWIIVSTIVVACITGIGWAIKHGIVDIAETAKKGVGE